MSVKVITPTDSVVRELYCKYCQKVHKHIITYEHDEVLEGITTIFFRGSCTGCIQIHSERRSKYTPPLLTHAVDNWNALMRNR